MAKKNYNFEKRQKELAKKKKKEEKLLRREEKKSGHRDDSTEPSATGEGTPTDTENLDSAEIVETENAQPE